MSTAIQPPASSHEAAYATPCEHWDENQSPCGKPSTYRYEAMGGGYMHLCDEHGVKHADISEHISGRLGRIAQPMPRALAEAECVARLVELGWDKRAVFLDDSNHLHSRSHDSQTSTAAAARGLRTTTSLIAPTPEGE